MGACLGKEGGAEPVRNASVVDGVMLLKCVTDPMLSSFVRPFEKMEDRYNTGMMAKVLGVGKWGSVKLVTDKQTGHKVALKSLKKRMLAARPERISPTIEVEAHAHAFGSVHGDNFVVGLEGVYEDAKHLYVVMENCEGGDLYNHISTREGDFTEDYIRDLMKQAFEAVEHLHSLGLAHRDIKPENMLFANKSHLKLCDFGSAGFFPKDDRQAGVFCDFVSTAYYAAPEVFTHKYGATCDVWALGVTIYVLLKGPPEALTLAQCKTRHEWMSLQKGELELPDGVSSVLKDLLFHLMQPDPKQRFSAKQVDQPDVDSFFADRFMTILVS